MEVIFRVEVISNLKMISTQAVETPVTTDNSPSEDYTASDAEPTINNFRNGGNNKKQTSSFCFITQEAALALADATQERLELENKLMALQAKKEQMDALLGQLQALRAAQLNKGMLSKGNIPFWNNLHCIERLTEV